MKPARVIWIVLIVVVAVGASSAWLLAQGPQPAFGQAQVSPPNIVFNTATPVTFTVKIDTPTLNPATVELQRVNASGQFLASVGRMLDNGQGGDAQRDDRIFTTVANLSEPQVGKVYFRVSAAFRGNKQNAQSGLIPLDVDPFQLPPDPGEPGKQTLEGIDTDKDGVRDDVQRWIGLTFQESTPTRVALNRYAGALQKYMTDASDPVTLASLTDAITASNCVAYIVGPNSAPTIISSLRNVVVNTDERFRLYLTSWRSVHELPPPPTEAELSASCSSPTVPN